VTGGPDDAPPEHLHFHGEELKTVRRADVYKGTRLAAHLTRATDGSIVFSYTRAWIEEGGPPLALTLPVTAEDHVTPAGAVPPYFAGLLPEGRRLGALRRSVKTSPDDELTLVLGIGGDAVGDVRVVAGGEPLDRVPPRLQVASFEQVRFADLLAEMEIRVDRVGVAGVQDKVSAAMLSLPVTAADAQVILKLNPLEFRHSVENEHFFLRAARVAGVRTVESTLVRDRDGEPGLAVTRFDRVVIDGQRTSLAVEDGCQALGLYPAAKYVVTTEELLLRLTSVCEAPLPAAAEFLGQVAFANLSANGDAHAKNFSVLQDVSGRWQPTPAYDLPTSQPYGDNTLALSVAGKRDQNIPGGRYVALGVTLGLPVRAATGIVRRIASSADIWLPQLDDLPFDHGQVDKLRRVIRSRQKMLLQI
jgi:serine/threonine-protein kinase HipA